jgi:competence protein ComEC
LSGGAGGGIMATGGRVFFWTCPAIVGLRGPLPLGIGVLDTMSGRRYQPLVPVLAAVCAGIFVDRYASPGLAIWWFLATVAWAAWLVLWLLKTERAACALLLVAAGATAGAWCHERWSLFRADDVGCFADARPQPVAVDAIVAKGGCRLPSAGYDPMRIIPQGDRTLLEVRMLRIRDGIAWRPISGRATLMIDGHLLGVGAGDRVRVFGQLASPAAARNPGEFDRADYMRGNRTLATLRVESPQCVPVVRRAGAWRPRRWLENAQNAAAGELWQRLDARHVGLASALLLGNREEIGPTESTAFQETGMAHLLAISGLNVGIVVWALAWVLRMMQVRRVPAAILIALAAVGYTLLTGSEPPVVRAAILVVILAAAIVLGRQPRPFNSLAAAALIVLALNPVDLFRAGPQLSFLAVAALMWYAPGWFGMSDKRSALELLIEENEPWGRRAWKGAARSAWHMTLMGLAIWLITLPLVMSRFNLLALVAAPLNTLLWLPIAVALCSGFAVLTVGWLLPPLGAVAAWVCNIGLWMIGAAIGVGQKIPYGHFWVPGPAVWWVWGFYGGVALAAVAGRWRPPRRWLYAMGIGWIGVGLLSASWPRESDRLMCTFLAVGHGSAVVIELPGGGTVLYDAGCFGSPQGAVQSIAAYLWQKGIARIDAVVLSHPDADHYNALPGLLDRFPVGRVYAGPAMFAHNGRSLAALREAIDAAGVPVVELAANDRLRGRRPCRIDVLHPPRQGQLESDNAASLVLAVEYLGRRILLTGDLEPSGLDDVLAEEPIPCNVLLVPHHGSQRSSPPGLVSWCRPEVAVISGSLGRFHPRTEAGYSAAGVRLLHTGRKGAVEVTVDGTGRLEVECFRRELVEQESL